MYQEFAVQYRPTLKLVKYGAENDSCNLFSWSICWNTLLRSKKVATKKWIVTKRKGSFIRSILFTSKVRFPSSLHFFAVAFIPNQLSARSLEIFFYPCRFCLFTIKVLQNVFLVLFIRLWNRVNLNIWNISKVFWLATLQIFHLLLLFLIA